MDEELKKIVEEMNKNYKEFTDRNDKRFDELKAGRDDPLLKESVDKLTDEVVALAEMKSRLETMETKLNRPSLSEPGDEPSPEQKEQKAALLKYLRKGEQRLTDAELKALSVGSDPDGGYYVTPEMSSRMIEKVYETSPMRELATIETINTADALEIPEDLGEAGAGWVGETGSRSETTTPQIGVRRIPAHEMYAEPKMTQKIIDDSAFNVEAWLQRKVGERFGRLENTSFVNGNGVAQPRGILTCPAGTTNPGQVEQIVSGHASQLTADGLWAMAMGLKQPYQQNATWLMKRITMRTVAQLKDDQGQYLWSPGLQDGQKVNLLGYGFRFFDDMPAVAANSLSIAFGDWRQAYTIVDRQGVRVLRDPFTSKPFVKLYTTKRTGGDVTNFEAFVIQKTAA